MPDIPTIHNFMDAETLYTPGTLDCIGSYRIHCYWFPALPGEILIGESCQEQVAGNLQLGAIFNAHKFTHDALTLIPHVKRGQRV